MPTLLVLGAGSSIAKAVSEQFAARGWNLLLAGRDLKKLEPLARALQERSGQTVSCHAFDVLDLAAHQTFWDALPVRPDAVLCAVGLLGNQHEARVSPALTDLVLRTNFNGPAHILGIVANEFERRGRGLIIAISSVAGERGRAANYPYGSAKAGLTAFLSGLRGRLAPANVRVLTVKPGLTDTPMLEGRTLPRYLVTSPEKVARDILSAVDRNAETIYTPFWWRIVMGAVRLMPERLFKHIRS